jgi:Protein of unknown function (DUF3305)
MPAMSDFPLLVSFAKIPLQSKWQDFQWQVQSVTVQTDDAVSDNPYTFSGLRMDFHPSEGEGYWLNLNSPEPSLFVMWRQEPEDPTPTPWVVTASYNEAGRMLDAGEKVERVLMPEVILAFVTEYAALHYKPEVRKKVRRNDPFNRGGQGASRHV